MYRNLIVSLFFCAGFVSCIYAQPVDSGRSLTAAEIERIRSGHVIRGQIINGDTVMHVYLGQVIILPPRVFKNERQRVRYTRLVQYVKAVYPYSQIIKRKLYQVQDSLTRINDPKEQKRFIKEQERELRTEFEGELVRLTITQGRILMRLVDRETGYTTYQLIEELKGSFNAVFWQSLARIFGSDLKKGYDRDGEDAMIEEIIILIENGQL